MAKIRIRRSTGTDAPPLDGINPMANAELAFAEGNDILYIGEGTSGANAATVLKIGGPGAFMALEGAQTVAGNKTFSNNVVVTGNLTVNGTTTTVATTNTTVSDNILELNSGAGSNANDCGILIERGSTGNNAFIGWDESADQFILGTTTATADGTGNLSITAGTIQGNVTGTATQLANTRTFALTGDVTGSATFNGTANASIAATIAAGAVDMAMLNASGTASGTTYLRGDGSWQTVSVSDTTYGISCVDGDNTDEEKIRLTSSGSATDDVVLEAGTGLSVARSGDKITFTNTVSDTNTTYSAGSGLSLSGTTFSVDTLNQNTTGNAATATEATNITASANNSTDETVYLTFVDGATGTQGIETDTGLSYNPSSGELTVGTIDGGTW